MSTSRELLIRPEMLEGQSGETLLVQPEAVGFEHLTFRVRKMARGESFSSDTRANELGLVVLGGSCRVASSAGSWSALGAHQDVFSGMPTALYLPLQIHGRQKLVRRFVLTTEAYSENTTLNNGAGARRISGTTARRTRWPRAAILRGRLGHFRPRQCRGRGAGAASTS